MGTIKLLDCTLRDGGYVNNWNFGAKAITDILQGVNSANIDIIETGFLRNATYSKDVTVFNDMRQVDNVIKPLLKEERMSEIAVMAEIAHPMPLDKIAFSRENRVDIVRVIIWKNKHDKNGNVVDALNESFEYCKALVDKGYQLCVQPNRTDQYSDEEFANLVRRFSELKPRAIYIVDSWGTMYSNQVIHYMNIADDLMDRDISLGFHAHNNMMQAFSTAEKIVEKDFSREVILDASICGMGRGAGNLNLELIARYLNVTRGYDYCIDPLYEIYDKYMKMYQCEYSWGSSIPFFITAVHNANPNYAGALENRMGASEFSQFLSNMDDDDKVLFPKGMPK